MNLVNKNRLEILEELEKKLDELDGLIAYAGIRSLLQAKQYVCFLKTSFYVEEQMNEDKIGK